MHIIKVFICLSLRPNIPHEHQTGKNVLINYLEFSSVIPSQFRLRCQSGGLGLFVITAALTVEKPINRKIMWSEIWTDFITSSSWPRLKSLNCLLSRILIRVPLSTLQIRLISGHLLIFSGMQEEKCCSVLPWCFVNIQTHTRLKLIFVNKWI